MFVHYLRNKFHMLDSTDSLVIAIKHEVKEIFILQPCGYLTRNKKLIYNTHFSKACNQAPKYLHVVLLPSHKHTCPPRCYFIYRKRRYQLVM